MGLSEVSNVLWKERQLLQLLLFKLHTERLILTSGEARFLGEATREVEIVIGEIKETELTRAVVVADLATELGLDPNASLRELSQAAPNPWDSIFDEHRKAFLADTQEISAMSKTNKELLTSGSKAARDALDWISSGGGGELEPQAEAYSKKGSASAVSQSGAKLVDRTA